jgi:hypothetical protein
VPTIRRPVALTIFMLFHHLHVVSSLSRRDRIVTW